MIFDLCEITGRVFGIAPSQSPTEMPTPFPTIECDNMENSVLFESRIKMDNWSSTHDETHWKLIGYSTNTDNDTWHDNVNGSIVAIEIFSDTSGIYQESEIVSNEICLPNRQTIDCYTFELTDDFGDGLTQTDASGNNYWLFFNHVYMIAQGSFIDVDANGRNSMTLEIDFCIS